MNKQKFTIEHELNARSENIIWELISTDGGLSKWIADFVESDNNSFVFSWGEPWKLSESRKATVISKKRFHYIRFAWDDEEEKDAYWELKIERNELTDDYILLITDFAEPSELDDQKELWKNSLELLRRNSGI